MLQLKACANKFLLPESSLNESPSPPAQQLLEQRRCRHKVSDTSKGGSIVRDGGISHSQCKHETRMRETARVRVKHLDSLNRSEEHTSELQSQ